MTDTQQETTQAEAGPVDPTIHLSADAKFYTLAFIVFAIVVCAGGWPMYSKWRQDKEMEEYKRNSECLQLQMAGSLQAFDQNGPCGKK